MRGNLRLERRLRSRLGLVGAVRVVLVEDALHRERGRLEAVRLVRGRGELALHADLHAHVCAERGPLGADRVEDVFLDRRVGEVPLGALEELVRQLDARLELGEARLADVRSLRASGEIAFSRSARSAFMRTFLEFVSSDSMSDLIAAMPFLMLS